MSAIYYLIRIARTIKVKSVILVVPLALFSGRRTGNIAVKRGFANTSFSDFRSFHP